MKRTILALSLLFFLLLWSPLPVNAEQTYNCTAGQHKYSIVSHTPATEQTDGSDVFRCELCGQEYEAVLPATGHTWGEWVEDKAPSCTEPGQRHRTCSAHKPHDETQIIPALGHDYKLTETPPGCDTDGVKTYACSRCGDSYTEPGAAALGHDYAEKITKEATCTENGIKTYTCSHDKSHNYTEPIPAVGHDFDEWTVKVPAKEGETGVETRICKNCGQSEQREIPSLAQPEQPEQPESLFNALDMALAGVDALLIIIGAVTLYPSLAAIRRVNKLWKQHLASKKFRG